MPVDPAQVPTSLVAVLVIAVAALAGTIVYLFKYYANRLADGEKSRLEHDKEIATERLQWAVERTRFEGYREEHRAEYEAKHRQLVEQQAVITRELYDALREHDNTARREYAANMEVVADKASEAADKIAAVLDKFYDRFVGSPRRGGGG